MKAIFKGSAGSEFLVKRNFTVGKEYDLEDAKFGFYITQDNQGKSLIFQNGVDYTFDLVVADSFIKSTVCEDSGNEVVKRNENKMVYRMNGVDVTCDYFSEKLLEVELLKAKGVSVFIDFEVSFE
ncbi:hypothetical protein bas03_0023 [Escherichia phage JulesPiccard]|uniref:Uncharacterized protein n=1 Tax=Escherichia phage JulesPiccard TaxID=2851956 RepID=A0AAE8B2R1_9CAUD|nr:hypothetical protein bas03_0023 [Escherichia phage JulesPiccard]